MNGLLIVSVAPESPAQRAGLMPGERLLAIDGSRLRDLIDYSWLLDSGELELSVQGLDGVRRRCLLMVEPGESPGLAFAAPDPKRCGNNCIFCFVHQLPKGLRRPLYVKDEDYRLSFLQGTYVTLTNLTKSELRRIVQQRLSPLYVSVHATDPAVRERLLGRQGITPILDQLTALAAGRIELHTQVVLCPGLNDGPVLEQTVQQLASLHPAVRSLAVVPVGLTSHRRRLPELVPVDRAYAAAFLDEWLPLMRQLNTRLGEPFLQIADEFFLKADRPFPHLREYGDLPQWENGVGMVPWFRRQAAAVLKRAQKLQPTAVVVVTGESAAEVVRPFLADLEHKTGCRLTAVAIPNRLFGSSVTVTGLVCGHDIAAALRGNVTAEALLVPEVMLKEGDGCFLDDTTLDDLSRELDLPVHAFEATPSGFYRMLKKLAGKERKHEV